MFAYKAHLWRMFLEVGNSIQRTAYCVHRKAYNIQHTAYSVGIKKLFFVTRSYMSSSRSTWQALYARTKAAKAASSDAVCMTRDVWRAHVFRFPARSPTYRICVTVLAQAQTSGRRYVIVDNYNTDMNTAGWSVRGGSILPFVRAHALPSCQRFLFSLQDVAHNHVIW